jgi:hypothetical protein
MTLLDWLTVAAAFTAEQLVDVPADASGWWAVLGGASWTLFALALRHVGVRLESRKPAAGFATRGMLAACIVPGAVLVPPAVAAALAWQGLPTACGGEGASPEAVMLAGLRGVLCGMLAVGTTTSETRFALATTLFMVVLAAIVNDHPATAAINAGYAAVAASALAARAAGATGRGGLPSPAGLVSCLAVAAVVAALGGSRDACGRAVVGWLPLSGGDSFAFPWARDGVGDGENLVAAKKNPQATGPVNSGVFVTSHKPSLYDLFNDLYGEPEKPKDQERKRAFSLGPQELPPTDQHLADSEHAGREFSTVRKARSPSRQPTTDLAARALVTLTGPAPAHLRLAVYDTFDGRAWRDASPPAAAAIPADCRLEHVGGDWMRWQDGPPSAAGTAADTHAITIGSVQTSVLPLPARAESLRIDKIDRPDFFRTPAADVVTLDGVEVPAGTTVHAQSLPGGVDATGVIAVAAPPAVAATAQDDMRDTAQDDAQDDLPDWAGDVLDAWGIDRNPAALGWPHVAGVVAEIQQRIVRDDAASPPADCPDTLRHMLTVSHRGRPYDFAGAAAVLLRSCGYSTRVVGGLHVSGKRRDVRSRRLVATADDAHVWAEIRDAAGRWIPLEPTPGFRLRPPTVPWTTRFFDALGEAAAWLHARAARIAAVVGGIFLVAAAVRLGWRCCVDAVATAWWRRAILGGAGCPLLATWQLIAWRAWLAGCPKRAAETVRDWHQRVVEPAALGRETTAFLTCFERAAYGPAGLPADRLRHRHVAASAARLVTVARLRGGERHPSLRSRQPRSRQPRLRQAHIQETRRWQLS